MIFDLSAGEQVYTEDCEVCCNPIQIKYRADDSGINDFEVIEQ